MGKREERQSEFSDIYLNSSGTGILYLCPRFGKIRVATTIFEKLDNPSILISYPDKQIKISWEEDFKKWGYKNNNIEWCTHVSLHKYIKKYDIVVIDEIHLLSEKQKKNLQSIISINDNVLGLTGTLSSFTERELLKDLGMKVLARYSIKKAIEEGIVSDYQITVKMIPLDNKVKNKYKGKVRTEKEQFDAYSAVISKLEMNGATTMFLRLARMRIIQNSLAKINETKNLLKQFVNERVLIFCGLIKTAEKLGCPIFHSKSTDQQIFDDFTNGKGNHMGVIKIGNTGRTYSDLNKVIINYFDSNSENLAQKINRCMAMEYNNPSKKADIWIITSDEEVELNWLNKALEFFDKDKINYV